MINLTRAAALELRRDGSASTRSAPAASSRRCSNAAIPSRSKRRFDTLQPWPEAGTGEHIAGAALFLASDDSEFVTGEALVVDGGLMAVGPALPRRVRAEPDDTTAQLEFVGLDKGRTGEPPLIRKLERKG